MVKIVNIVVTQTQAPTPSLLQQTGALISQGGTNTAAGTLSLITQPSDLTPIVEAMITISSISYATGLATYTVPAGSLPYPSAEPINVVVSGTTPAGYSGAFAATVTSATSFTVPIATTPGTATVFGNFVVGDAPELLSMVTTYFAQGTNQAVYVLELGAGDPAVGVAALQAWIVANPNKVYAWLVPREWDGEITYLAFVALYQATTAKVYFFTTTTLATYTQYTNLQKAVVAWIEAPTTGPAGIARPVTEFTAAAQFYNFLASNPSATNKVGPFKYRYLFGVTPYPLVGNGALLTTIGASDTNYVITGAEGGITTALAYPGCTKDGRDMLYWYSVDWTQINLDLNCANAIINGSNNPQNPLYYNQDGIDSLLAVVIQTMTTSIAFGLVLGPVQVTATPFITYVTENPGDFKLGNYNGFGVTMTPSKGFNEITIVVNVTDFPAA